MTYTLRKTDQVYLEATLYKQDYGWGSHIGLTDISEQEFSKVKTLTENIVNNKDKFTKPLGISGMKFVIYATDKISGKMMCVFNSNARGMISEDIIELDSKLIELAEKYYPENTME